MKNNNLLLRSAFMFINVCLFAACTPTEPPLPTLLSSIRPNVPGSETINIKINRLAYANALKNLQDLRRLRLVEIVNSAQATVKVPEYRLFGINDQSAAAMLGLKNNDVLVAANDYIIHEPPKFKAYMNLLVNEKQAFIEIRRDSQPIVLRYEFVD